MSNTILNQTNEGLLYVNSFGVLFKNSIVLHHFNKNTPINLEQIRKIVIVKRRVFLLNFIIFLSSVFTVVLCYSIQNLVYFEVTISVLILAAIQFWACFMVKINKYKMIVVRKESEPIIVEFTKHFKIDAILIMHKVNKYLKQFEKHTIQFST